MVARIRDLLKIGALDDAVTVADEALTRSPDDAQLHYLRGVAANRLRDHRRAIEAFKRALSIDAKSGLAWLGLGNALTRAGDLRGAASAYDEALVREPAWTDAHFNLGLVCERLDDLPRAARAFHAAWDRDPTLVDAAKKCLATLARIARENPALAQSIVRSVRAREDAALDAPRRSFTIVVCSIDETKHRRVEALYQRLFAGVRHEIVVIRDARSLASAYNGAVAQSRADIVILSHDDIDILADDFAARVASLLEEVDVIGVVGNAVMRGPTIGWSGLSNVRGWITHAAPDEEGFTVDAFSSRRIATDVIVIDGVLMAARRKVFADIAFDEETFDGFHLYDLDWSYRASKAGCRLATSGELLVVHASRGKYDDVWARYADRFCLKHRLYRTQHAPSTFFGADVETPEQVRAFFGLLGALDASPTS